MKSGVRNRPVLLAAAAAALLGSLVYANSLGNGLVYDDLGAIVRNEAARDATDWRTILLTPSWKPQGDRTAISYRPLATWTFAIDYAVHGVQPFGYHLVNVLGHSVVSFLVVLLGAAFGLSAAAAGLAGILFAVHPVHSEVVANGVGRAEILAAALAVSALLLARRAATANWPAALSAGAAAAYGLGLLAKEHTVALLAVIPLADLLMADGRSPAAFVRGAAGRRRAFYAALLAITVGYLALRATALGSVVGAAGGGFQSIVFWANPAASAPTASRVLTAFEVLALASRLLVWPYTLSADYSYRQVPVIASVGDPRAWAGIAVAVALVLAAIAARRRPAASVWLGLAALTYAVVSNIPFPIGTIFGERLLYLPSVGVCALAGMILTAPASRPLRAACFGVVLAVVVSWSIATVRRNPVWHDDLSLGVSMVASAPESVHAHHFLGVTYAELGRNDEGLAELQRAVAILPDDASSLYNIAVILQGRGETGAAMALYRRVVDIDPAFFPAWINLSLFDYRQGRYLPALEAADRAVAAAPGAPAAHVVRANALRALGRHEEARNGYAAAVHAAPEWPDALFGLGATALDLGDFPVAAEAFGRLVAIAPSIGAYRGLVSSLTQAGRAAEAQQARAAARTRYPREPSFTGDAASQ
jgi:tetratricopeptide (TPR) repeat protein